MQMSVWWCKLYGVGHESRASGCGKMTASKCIPPELCYLLLLAEHGLAISDAHVCTKIVWNKTLKGKGLTHLSMNQNPSKTERGLEMEPVVIFIDLHHRRKPELIEFLMEFDHVLVFKVLVLIELDSLTKTMMLN